MASPPILLFTDFGPAGPYLGQMRTVLLAHAPGAPVIDILADAPRDPMPAAYLLAALARDAPEGAIWLAVVDPGVGSARRPALLEIDGNRYVGPDNGLFAPLVRRAKAARGWEITWRPQNLSASFHGRDLFAPVAARIALRETAWRDDGFCAERPIAEFDRPGWPDELARVVYIDHFGNAMTGIRAAAVPAGRTLEVSGRRLGQARTFADMPAGEALWYENSSGLVEIAVNQGRADRSLGLTVGTPVTLA